MLRGALLAGLLPCASGHGAVQYPPTWHDPDGSIGLTAGTQCQPGCTGRSAPGQLEAAQGCMCEWYTNWTFAKKQTMAMSSKYRTYANGGGGQAPFNLHPWFGPGSAPIFSPCGHDGGNPTGCPAGNPNGAGCAGGGYGHGPDARSLKGNTKPAVWGAPGDVVEAMWGITANHGGGYQYRLCPRPKSGNLMEVTEACFQKTPLKFAKEHQWVQYGKDPSTRKSWKGMVLTEGTTPAGSQWMRNPIPACGGGGGGAPAAGGYCSGTQFTPPLPGLFGFGLAGVGEAPFEWSIVDKLQLPADLPEGDYVLSFRWDCEQTAQVWSSCSDVRVKAGSGPAPPAPAADKYVCTDGVCVVDPSGVSKKTCLPVCHGATAH